MKGHELQVMIGAKNTILTYKPALVFETGSHPQSDINRINDILYESNTMTGMIKGWGIE